jgi:glyoxylase I family protein
MRIEHVAFNVAEPVEMAAWYVAHLGMRVVRFIDDGTATHFLADSSGQSLIEIYRNPRADVPDYAAQHPLVVHIAFVADDAMAETQRLEAAGARLVDEVRKDDGSVLLMLRDPWGLAIQLCQRAAPML